MRKFSILLLALFLLLMGCEKQTESDSNEFILDVIPNDTLKGHYSSGFESSTFKPCNSDELWWTNGGTSQLFSIYGSIATTDYESVFVQVKGDVSELGTYGHLGMYDKEFTVTDLFEMRKEQIDDCAI